MLQITTINALFGKTREQHREVYVQPLLRAHPEIRDVRTLRDKINSEALLNDKRTIRQMSKHTFNTQPKYNTSFSYDEIHSFIDNLFTKQSLKGCTKEEEAIIHLNNIDKRYEYKPASAYQDLKHNQDIIAWNGDNQVLALQCKPSSYRHVDNETKLINLYKMTLSPIPTHFIYYDSNNQWTYDVS